MSLEQSFNSLNLQENSELINNSLTLQEKSDLNDRYKGKVFDILQTKISQSEANEYKIVCELFDEFLEKKFLYTYQKEKFRDTDVFLTGIKLFIIKFEKNPEQVLGLIKYVFQIVIDIEESENDNKHDDRFQDKYLKSWLVLVTLMSLKKITNLIIEGTWEDVLYALLEYIRPWHMEYVFTLRCITSQAIQTLGDVFCRKSALLWTETALSPTLCPSPYLRLEILQILLTFDPDGVKHRYGMMFMTAYCECISDINPDKLFSIMGINLLTVRWLMVCNYKRYFKTIRINFGSKVDKTLHLNKMGKEVRFFTNSLNMLGMFAQAAKLKYNNDVPFVINCLSLCLDMITLSKEAFFSTNVYKSNLFLPYTCGALADITDGILTLSALLNEKDLGPCKTSNKRSQCLVLYDHIVKQRNNILQDLEIPENFSLQVMLHQRELSGHKFKNILMVKKAALLLPELELGIVCNDQIIPFSNNRLRELMNEMIFDTDSECTDSDEGEDDTDESPTNYYTDSDEESACIYFDGGKTSFGGFFQEYLN